MTSVRRSAFCIDFPLQLALECKARLFVEAVDLFVINMDAFSLQHHMDTAVSKPFPVRCACMDSVIFSSSELSLGS